MPRAFLSYAREDRRWVPLVKRLLDFHRIVTWLDTDSIQPGSDYRDALEEGIRSTDLLLVVVARGAARSKWVPREISSFRAVRPGSPIVPLVFDEVPLDEIFDGLSGYQSVSFLEDLDAGFLKLFSYLSVPYLEQDDRRASTADRRDGERRDGDRRRATTEQRLRLGLWKELQSKTGIGEYDEFGSVTPQTSVAGGSSSILSFRDFESSGYGKGTEVDIASAILRYSRALTGSDSEVSRYNFRDKESGDLIELDNDMLREIFHRVYRQQESIGGRTANIYVVEQVAFALIAWFDIEPKNRRTEDRRSGSDRRLEQ